MIEAAFEVKNGFNYFSMMMIDMPVAFMAVFLWIGFVCAISFMEAWLKFRAPGITLPLGLGIGRLVFGALNKVEWAMAIVIFINLIFYKKTLFTLEYGTYFLPVIFIAVQAIWMLPALGRRADLYIRQVDPPPSRLHFYYVGMELVKIVSLVLFGISLLKNF